MKILYAIALVSFAALLWAAFAISRHVRKGASAASVPPAAEAHEVIEQRLQSLTRKPPADTAGETAALPRPDAS